MTPGISPSRQRASASSRGQQRRELFGLLVSRRRNNGPNWRNGAWTKLIRMRRTNRLPLPILRRVLDEVPEGARVRRHHAGRGVSPPGDVRDHRRACCGCSGSWVAEGSSYEEAQGRLLSIISCEEPVLRRAQEIVERELGLHVVWAPASDARSASIFIHSKLLLRLMEHLGFGRNRKRIPGWILGLPL